VAAHEDIRARLSANSYFKRLPAATRKSLIKGHTVRILTDDQILDRLGTFDQNARTFLRFISTHADLSPVAYYLTGDRNRGRGEENDTDKGYMTVALDLATDAILRATNEMNVLFQSLLSAGSSKPPASKRDERVERFARQVLRWEGCNLGEFTAGDGSGAPLLCSKCFHDEGLRLSSTDIGVPDFSKCPNCGSQDGKKLSRQALGILAHQFFVWGTIRRLKYGGFPAVQFNHDQVTSISVGPWLETDLRLIGEALQVGFFQYGRRTWMAGEIGPLNGLLEPGTRAKVISDILDQYPGRILNTDESFYRLRKAPADPHDFDQYDSPPTEFAGLGRFETAELPILYGSQDIEVCLHECRVTADDEIYIATFAPRKGLKLLNLAEPLLEDGLTEFESLDMAVHMLFLAGRHSYEVSQDIARAAYKSGFDGLVYSSYFTLLRTGEMPFATTFGISHRRIQGAEYTRKNTIENLALFGRPVKDGSIAVRSINRVVLNKVVYGLHFGPVLFDTVDQD
jgi:hypothetical protein